MAASTVTDLHVRSPLGHDELIRAFRTMYLSRRVDDREIVLKNQSKIYFQVSAAGHEAIQTAAGMAARPGHDWFYPYYRDRALALALGVTPKEMFLQAVGSAEDRASGGRQMPSHWSSPRLHIVSGASPTGTHFVQAVGCAEATRLLEPQSDAITMVSSGEGATSEGEFWESLNVACLDRHPVVYLIEDNGYAISVPAERQTAGGNIAALVRSFPAPGGVRMRRDEFPRVVQGDGGSGGALPAGADSGAGARELRAAVFAFALRSGEAVQAEGGARRRSRPRSRSLVFRVAAGGGRAGRRRAGAIEKEIDREVQEASEEALTAPAPASGNALKFFTPTAWMPPPANSRRSRSSKVIRAPWWIRSIALCMRRCGATPTWWCSAKTWPIAAAKKICTR